MKIEERKLYMTRRGDLVDQIMPKGPGDTDRYDFDGPVSAQCLSRPDNSVPDEGNSVMVTDLAVGP